MNLAATDINLLFPAFNIASICAAVGIAMMLTLKIITRQKLIKTETHVKE